MSREAFEAMPDVMDVKQLAEAQPEMYSASFGAFLLDNRFTFPIQEPRKIREKQEVL